MNKAKYITTPIYYLNGKPHLGHAYTTIIGDVLKRTFELRGESVFYTTGTDEHGQKNSEKIAKLNISFDEYVEKYSANFKKLFTDLNVKYDFFAQTSFTKHKEIVCKCLQIVYDKGLIIKKKYVGLYCTGCEQFKKESDLDKDGQCPDHQTKPIELSEENYFLQLEPYRQWLVDYINQNPNWIQPINFKNEVLGMLKTPLDDLCISRPRNRVPLGIEMPFDKDYIVYIWFDALINYISNLDWPNDIAKFNKYWTNAIHLMAKDIIKPHCVYWPIILKSLDLPLPKNIMVHGFLVGEGGIKMSKSLGNIIDPEEIINEIGVDAFRFILLYLTNVSKDTQISKNIIYKTYDLLANNLGNLCFRIYKLIEKCNDGVISNPNINSEDQNFINQISAILKDIIYKTEAISDISINSSNLLKVCSDINTYINEKQPWILVKDNKKREELMSVLYVLSEGMRMLAISLNPIMPTISCKILSSMDYDISQTPIEKAFELRKLENFKMKNIGILFPKLETIQEDK